MPRGFKKDLFATELAYATKNLIDEKRRSFISVPKAIAGEGLCPMCEGTECSVCDSTTGEFKAHLILYGNDKAPIRAEIFRLNRLENDGVNRCWKCERVVLEFAPEWHPAKGDWDHIRNKAGERCDDISNGRVSCRKDHSERHPQTQFGRHEIII